MEQLQAQLTTIQQQIADEKSKGAARNDNLIASLENDEAAILAKMDEAAREQQTQAEHTARIEQAVVQINNAIESVDIDGTSFPLRVFIPKEEDYQMVLIHFNKTFVAQAEQFSRQIAAQKAEINQEQYQNAQLMQRNAELTTLLNQAEAQRDNNKASSDDFESKLKNAAAEIERLEGHVDDLRKQIAVGVTGAIQVESTEDEAEKIRKWKESRKIYNVRWKDESKKTTYLANLLSTGEEIEIVHYAINSWTEVTAEEAERFRAEHAVDQSETSNEPDRTDDIPDTPLDVIDLPQVPSFPSQEEVPLSTNSGDTSVSEVVEAETVSRAEFEAVKLEVTMLAVELKARNILPMNWVA